MLCFEGRPIAVGVCEIENFFNLIPCFVSSKELFLSMFSRRMDTQLSNYHNFGLKKRLCVFEPPG